MGDARAGRRVAPAVSDGLGLSIIVNPNAGADASDDVVEALRRAFPAADVHEPDSADDFDDALEAAGRSEILGVAGGDGSINAAAERALKAEIPLAIVPGGTLNHFARDVGVGHVDDTISALRSGSVRRVDVGLIGGDPFLNTASFGSYADLVDARERLEDRIGKWPAMAVALMQVLRRAKPVSVSLDGRDALVWMIFIGNCEYRPEGLAPNGRDRLDDGVFDIRYVDGARRFSRLRVLVAAMTGRLDRSPVFHRWASDSLEIRSGQGPLRLARDGETFDGGEVVSVRKHPNGLLVYAPPG